MTYREKFAAVAMHLVNVRLVPRPAPHKWWAEVLHTFLGRSIPNMDDEENLDRVCAFLNSWGQVSAFPA